MTTIRKARPEDVQGIADIFSVLYANDHGYTNADVVRGDIQNPNITSFVAVEKNVVVGHGQLRPPEYDFAKHENDGVEIARLGVDGRYQNKGICKRIVEALNDFVKLESYGFVFADFNTATDYSQRAMSVIGLTPVALLLEYSPDFAKIGQANSFLLGMKINEEQDKAVVYVPEEHRKLAELVYSNLGLKRKIREKAGNGKPMLDFELKIAGYVFDSQKAIENQGYNPNVMAIDLSQPSALEKVQIAQGSGLVVEGLVPLVREQDGTRQDKLVMGYLPNLDLSKVKVSQGSNEQLARIILESHQALELTKPENQPTQ
ncbi:GNAT family N-acetyltransferase [Candidatus Woesearchaeota archaeon]|nr:GNAT family N-acetyltransferase [Candidatus Woesearchaeota archaeon]